MKIEVTSTSVSKKGTVWMQVKLLEGDVPPTGVVLQCEPAKDKNKPIDASKEPS